MKPIRPFEVIDDIVKIIIRALNYIGIAALVCLMLFTVADVFLRYAFNRPIYGSTEIAESMLVTFAFIFLAYCAMRNGNVAMDFLSGRLSPKGLAVVDMLGYIFCLAVMIPMTCYHLPAAIQLKHDGLSSLVLGIPTYPFYIVIFVSCLMLSFVLIANLVKSLIKLVK